MSWSFWWKKISQNDDFNSFKSAPKADRANITARANITMPMVFNLKRSISTQKCLLYVHSDLKWENVTKISVKDPDLKRSEGRIWIRNDPPGSIRIRIWIRNNSLGSATLQVHGQLILQVQKTISVIRTESKYFNPKRIDL